MDFAEQQEKFPEVFCIGRRLKFTLLTRDVAHYLVDRDSERRESAAELSRRVNQRSI